MVSSAALAANSLTSRFDQPGGFGRRSYSDLYADPSFRIVPHTQIPRSPGWTGRISLNAARRQQAIATAKIFGIGALTGFGVKLLITTLVAAFGLPVPGIAVMMAAAIAGGVISSIVSSWAGSRIRKTELERGWLWKAIKHGFIAGTAGGLFGAILANFIPVEHLFHHQSNSAVIPPAVPAPAATAQEFMAASHHSSPFVTIPAEPGLELPKNLHDFVSSPAFHDLPPHLQKLGVHALASKDVQVKLHFYKEASFQLINGHGHTLASERMGKALVNLGADYARTTQFHDVNAAMLFRDQLYLNKLHHVFHASHAAIHHVPHAAIHHVPHAAVHHVPRAAVHHAPIHAPVHAPIHAPLHAPIIHVPAMTHPHHAAAVITSPFGMRLEPFHHAYWEMHNGIDFAAPGGTPIYAATDGTVQKIVSQGWGGGYGKYVLVEQNGRISMIYAHMRGVAGAIHPGTHVSKGDMLGYVGSTGRSTGNHLYFSVMDNGKPVNPINVVDTGSRGLADLLLG